MMLRKFAKKLFDDNFNRKGILFLFDVLCFAILSAIYFFVSQRASGSPDVNNGDYFIVNITVQLIAVMTLRVCLGTYKHIWRYPNTVAYLRIVIADTIGGFLTLTFIRAFLMNRYYGMWQAVEIGALNALLALTSRFVYSILYRRRSVPKDGKAKAPVVIVGAGSLGARLADDLINNRKSELDPQFFVDSDRLKIGGAIQGLPVYSTEEAENLIRKLEIKDVIIAITSKGSDDFSEIFNRYSGLGCRVRICETLMSDSRAKIRDFTIDDLLFREPVMLDGEKLSCYSGKTVLVTGGGGSIGSEICRQIASCHPKKLIIFDIYENNAYDIQQELVKKYGKTLDFTAVIGSVRDTRRLDEVFSQYRPEIVFHAAAHKHVPLMEDSGCEAVKNNCIGTYNVANAAEKYGTEKFILISTDKAVNPTNIMGASKRICEMVIQCRTDSKTSFAAVRFGNVLGSNGSVIPLFKKQIEEGGPVTITDSRIIRYFMTIPEASRLVLTAGAMAENGELFVLDMGKPVKIYDLAENMIRLSGFEPGRDIQIEEIGLRPGEKLYEELLMKDESLTKTENEKIFIERDAPLTREEVDGKLAFLAEEVAHGGNIREAMRRVVPTFRDPDEVNLTADTSEEMIKAEKEAVTV